MTSFLAVLSWKMVIYTVLLVGALLRIVVVSRRNARLRAEAAAEREARAKAEAEADTLHAELVRRQEELLLRQRAASEAIEKANQDAKGVPDDLKVPELIRRLREEG